MQVQLEVEFCNPSASGEGNVRVENHATRWMCRVVIALLLQPRAGKASVAWRPVATLVSLELR